LRTIFLAIFDLYVIFRGVDTIKTAFIYLEIEFGVELIEIDIKKLQLFLMIFLEKTLCLRLFREIYRLTN
jgi:hypothetical protein